MSIRFKCSSFLVFLVLFIIEVLIALYVRDAFIRPYGGDILVIPLIYYFVDTFLKLPTLKLIIGVVAFAFIVEFGQYFQMVKVLGLEASTFWNIVLGNSYHYLDLVCYVAGGILTWAMVAISSKRK